MVFYLFTLKPSRNYFDPILSKDNFLKNKVSKVNQLNKLLNQKISKNKIFTTL